jgi:Lysylphosphatidylglycerol synthase TM region
LQEQVIFEEGKLNRLNKNIKLFLNYFLGPVLFVWVCYSVWKQISNQPDLEKHLQNIYAASTGKEAWKLLAVILLMFVNWGIEARKWQVLLSGLHRISFLQSFKAILSGVAFSLNTPNRIGEYGGRVLFIPAENRIRAISLTIAGSFSQLLVTLSLGAAGLFFLSDEFARTEIFNALRIWMTVLKTLVIFAVVIGFVIYFRLSWLIRGVEKLPGLERLVKHIAVLEGMNVTILLRVLTLSLTRFMVFIIQYVLMLQLMQVEVSWWQGFWSVSVLFLLLATIPTIALLELGLRWEYSIVLFSLFSTNIVGMYAAATGIWLINLVMPAMAGSLFLLGIRIYKSK